MSFIILKNNFRNEYSRWVSLLLFIAGFASFSVVVNLYILPDWRVAFPNHPWLLEAIRLFTIVTWGVEFHFFPYLFLMSAFIFASVTSKRVNCYLMAVLAVPILVYLYYIPSFYPVAKFGHPLFTWLAGMYFLSGTFLYGWSYLKEGNALKKKNSLRTNMLMCAVWYVYLSDYCGVDYFYIHQQGLDFSSNDMWKYNYLTVLWFVLFFLYFGLKHGILGIKLRIEKQKLDSSMKALTQGTLIVNHTIKNEVQKIHYLNGKIEKAIRLDQKEEALQGVSNILKVTEHILHMVDRMKDRSGEITVIDQSQRLRELLDICLANTAPFLLDKQIQLHTEYTVDPILLCDPSHVKETLNNLILNAIDAMEPGKGILEVMMTEWKGDLVIGVKDNGTGITKENASKVFDPFFTTKKGSMHYGLGLSYSYSVMQKHGGSLSVTGSELNKGTWMELRFPRKRVLVWGKETEIRQTGQVKGIHPPLS